MACNQLEVDIISLNLTEALHYHFKRTSIGVVSTEGFKFFSLTFLVFEGHKKRAIL